ncbi:hypothetical protein MXD61_01945 [Frankia sp. AgPm24]|uniref:Uncharacterized protein n=1 Tax=Frankia umida TaxID=573489 RepID=A0ABT0K5F6_9ACTN|nr:MULTISPECIES: hypothetical protein [Frankia]MCK9879013.1 hypothetical protein [Frankia umida]MCK9920681.1 hypothetical protein [Frankia sp. AgPm24]
MPLAAGYLLAEEALDPDSAAPERGTLWTITLVAVVGALVHFALASAAVAICHRAYTRRWWSLHSGSRRSRNDHAENRPTACGWNLTCCGT